MLESHLLVLRATGFGISRADNGASPSAISAETDRCAADVVVEFDQMNEIAHETRPRRRAQGHQGPLVGTRRAGVDALQQRPPGLGQAHDFHALVAQRHAALDHLLTFETCQHVRHVGGIEADGA